MIATADTFAKAHDILVDMMTRAGGVNDWSTLHNSPLEYSKLALIDFAHGSSMKERLPLQLLQRVIDPSTSTKYLRVIFNQNLSWKAQQARAIGKGADWSMQIKRLTRLTWGIIPSLARRLLISVAIPRILYTADVWCPPPGSSGVAQRGSVRAIERLALVQRIGATAITGALRTSPTDSLNTLAFLLPMLLLVSRWCHRAAV